MEGSKYMAKGVLFIGWGPAIPGRELKSLQVFNEAIQYWTGLQKSGTIDSFEPVFLEPHGGDLGGFVLLHGDEGKLGQLRLDPEFLRLNGRAQWVVGNLGVVMGFTGESIDRMVSELSKNAAELA
jgi:hypothetical protein